MESIMQTGMKRENYYEGTIIDIRKIFVGFGHYLERLGIEEEGEISDYEQYLIEVDKRRELKRQDEHLHLLKWIDENTDDDFPFKISTRKEFDRFYNSDDEDDIMDMLIIECDEFYARFKEITGVNLLSNNDFIEMSYIDESQNDIELVVRINDRQERFIIGV
jgi:hypothetical protein